MVVMAMVIIIVISILDVVASLNKGNVNMLFSWIFILFFLFYLFIFFARERTFVVRSFYRHLPSARLKHAYSRKITSDPNFSDILARRSITGAAVLVT